MVDIKNKRCACGKHPYLGFPGDTTPTCCSSCKKDGMVDIKSTRCACGKRHSYCFPGDRGKRRVKTSAPQMAMARVRAGALPKEQKWCQAARRAMASLRSAYDSDVACAAMHSAGGASSSCAAAAAASLGAAPPAGPRGVESRGFAFSAHLEIPKAGSPAEKLGMARAGAGLGQAPSSGERARDSQGIAVLRRNYLRGSSQRET